MAFFINLSIILPVFGSLLVIKILAFPGGVPLSQCASMSPVHKDIQPQTSRSPFSVMVDRTSVQPGQAVRVTLTSTVDGEKFIGFFAMGERRSSGRNSKPFGIMTFPKNEIMRNANCNDIQGSAISHSYPVSRSQAQFEWTAPLEEGEYVIL